MCWQLGSCTVLSRCSSLTLIMFQIQLSHFLPTDFRKVFNLSMACFPPRQDVSRKYKEVMGFLQCCGEGLESGSQSYQAAGGRL